MLVTCAIIAGRFEEGRLGSDVLECAKKEQESSSAALHLISVRSPGPDSTACHDVPCTVQRLLSLELMIDAGIFHCTLTLVNALATLCVSQLERVQRRKRPIANFALGKPSIWERMLQTVEIAIEMHYQEVRPSSPMYNLRVENLESDPLARSRRRYSVPFVPHRCFSQLVSIRTRDTQVPVVYCESSMPIARAAEVEV